MSSKAAPLTPEEDAALRDRIRTSGYTLISISRAANIKPNSLSKFMCGKSNSRLLGPLRDRLVAALERLAPVPASPTTQSPQQPQSQPRTQGEPMDLFEELFAEVRTDMVRRESEVDQLAARATKAIEAWRNAKRAVLKYELASRMGLKKEAPVGVHDAALAILAACEQIPECAQAMREMRETPLELASTVPPPAEASQPAVRSLPEAARLLNDPPVTVPLLASQAMPVAIIGGQSSQDKLRWVRESIPRVEWLEMPANVSGQSVLDRISNRRFSGVVLLSSLLHANNADRVRTAAAAAKVPCASVSTAGHGQLRTAFEELESKLRSAS